MSASSGLLIVSFFTVIESIGPISSRSGKKTSNESIWLPSARTTERTRGERGSLPSSTTSPVRGSTMSATVEAPSRSASVISISCTSSRWISARWAAVIFLPAWTISSRLPLASLGPKMALESLRPTRFGEIFQKRRPSRARMRSAL